MPLYINGTKQGGNITIINADGNKADVQYPLPVDGYSVYEKDINLDETTTTGTFTGAVQNLFNSYTATEALTDSSATNPKTFTIKLKRPILTSNFGIASATGNFSNVKLEFKDTAGTIRRTVDDTANNTKYTSNVYPFEPVKFVTVVVEFHTGDPVSLNGASIDKDISTESRIQALKPDGTVANIGATADGALNVSNQDSGLAIARGLVTGSTTEYKFGRNDAVGTTNEAIWDGGGLYNFIPSATLLNVSSSSTADAPAGAGALTVNILGLDANNLLQEEIVTLNGQTPVSTVNTYNFVYRCIVATEGSGANANVGDLYVYTGTATAGVPDTATNIHAKVQATFGQTLMTPYRVPAGKTGYILNGWATSGAGKNVRVQFFNRPKNGAKNLKYDLDILNTVFNHDFWVPLTIAGETDIWIEAKVDTGSTKVAAGYDIILVDD